MTAEAAIFARARWRAVTGVTTIAGCMSGYLMQARQLLGLVATLASWRRGDPTRPVGAVAIGASCADFAMRGAGLLGMTRRASLGGRAGVGLVTIAACLVPRGGAALLGLVAIAAILGHRSAVRLVTRRALCVPRISESALRPVARAAAGDPLLRTMR